MSVKPVITVHENVLNIDAEYQRRITKLIIKKFVVSVAVTAVAVAAAVIIQNQFDKNNEA